MIKILFNYRIFGKIDLKVVEIWFASELNELEDIDLSRIDYIQIDGCFRKLNLKKFEEVERYTLVIDLNQDLNKIWSNMDKSSCRYMIRRGEREGIEIIVDTNGRYFEKFVEIDKSFRKAKGLLPKRNEFYQSLKETLKKGGLLLLANYNNKFLASHYYIYDENIMRWYIGSSIRYANLSDRYINILVGCANCMLIWEAIQYSKEQGLNFFDLGGYYTGKSDIYKLNINKFKKKFGGNLKRQYRYVKYSNKLSKLLIKLFNVPYKRW